MGQDILTRAELEAHDPDGGKGGRWLCPLPACADHTDPRRHRSLDVSRQGQKEGVFFCHRCKAKGQLKDYWKEKEFKPFKSFREQEKEARAKRNAEESRKLEEIGARFRGQATKLTGRLKPLSAASLAALGASGQAPAAVVAPATSETPRTVHPELKETLYRSGSLQGLDCDQARAFLSLRGLSEFSELLTRARVRFAPDFGRRIATEEKGAYQGAPALVFPISDDAGQLVAFQGRKTTPGEGLKVLTFGPKTRGLFWAPGSREAFQKGEGLAICEAPLDALTLSVCEVPAVALCGSSHLPEFLTRGAFGRRYWLAFDADEAGDQAAHSIGAELRGRGAIVTRLRPAYAKDWNEALQTQGEVWDRTAEALLALMASEAEAGRTTHKQATKAHTGEAQTLDIEHLTKAENSTKLNTEKASPLLSWALSEARRGTLPELSEAMTLPSGQVCPADGVAAWLLAAEARTEGLRSHSGASVDCALALEVVLRDMRALALWARHARLWLDAPYTHQGEVSLLPSAEEELRQLAAEFEADLPEVA